MSKFKRFLCGIFGVIVFLGSLVGVFGVIPCSNDKVFILIIVGSLFGMLFGSFLVVASLSNEFIDEVCCDEVIIKEKKVNNSHLKKRRYIG